MQLAHFGDAGDAVHPRHVEIEQRQRDIAGRDRLERRIQRSGRAQRLDITRAIEHGGQRLSIERMIVRDHDPSLLAASHARP